MHPSTLMLFSCAATAASDRDPDLVMNITLPELVELTPATFVEPPMLICRNGSRRTNGCFIEECVRGLVWNRASVNNDDPECCSLWDSGCALNITAVQNYTADESITASATFTTPQSLANNTISDNASLSVTANVPRSECFFHIGFFSLAMAR